MDIINLHFRKPLIILREKRYLIKPPGFKRLWSDWISIIEGLNVEPITFKDKKGNSIEANPSDPHSPYYGASIYKIINAYNKGEKIEAKLLHPCYRNKDGSFAGYELLIGQVFVFMPASFTESNLKSPEKIKEIEELTYNKNSLKIKVKVVEIDTEKFNIIVSSID